MSLDREDAKRFAIIFSALTFVACLVGSVGYMIDSGHPLLALFTFVIGVSALATVATSR